MKINYIISLLALTCNTTMLIASANPAVVNLTPAHQELQLKSLNKPEARNQRLMSFKSFDGNNTADLGIKGTVDFFYGKHTSLFSASDLDQTFNMKSNWDAFLDTNLNNNVKTKLMLRTKANWGNETSTISSTSSTIKLGDAATGSHNHAIPRLVPWVREAWLDFSVNEALSLERHVEHRVKMGAFPFSLGRGISLGSAFAATHGFLGFCASNIIDQFAFGTVLYGDIIKNQLTYNAYVGILENYSDSFGRVNEIVNENRIGSRDNPERGFGVINFVVAFNLKWKPLNSPEWNGNFEVEPYVMYNHAPQQMVEVLGDSRSKLGTVGLCMDYTGSRWEWGFDTAFNLGAQYVYGLDRNNVQVFLDSDGSIKNRYSDILVGSNTGSKAVETSGLKSLVNKSGQGEVLNGQLIGTVNETTCCATGPVNYYNSKTRFRSPYTNAFKGMMLAMDAAYSLYEDQTLKLVGTAAWASGDENPNRNLNNPFDSEVDGDYQGFIGLQEIYSGKRIESLFLIGNNRVSRPLSTPTFVTSGPNPTRVGFASVIGGFTNIAFVGAGFDYKTSVMSKKWRIRPSVISYWQDFATKKFDVKSGISLNEPADKHLGTELNAAIKIDLVGEITGYFIGGIFVPGQHYVDIAGTPLNATQAAALDRLDSTGYPVNGIPVLGTSTAIALNWGLDICF